MKYYSKRDIMQLDVDGNYYARHVQAMTEEGLFSKSDIAGELAFRDKVIHDQAETIKGLDRVMALAGKETKK